MSLSNISVQRVDDLQPHPYADRLEIVTICGYTVVSQKGSFRQGQNGIFFPPDNLIPTRVAEILGVAKYLKYAVYPGDEEKTKCRIGAARLRGVSSFGFVIPTELEEIDLDLNDVYEAVRYEPPPKLYQGDQIPEHPKFHRYTEIENVQRFPEMIPVGTPVAISEKIHGTNARLAVIDGEFIAGSHNCQRAAGDNIYWRALEPCLTFLNDMKEDGHDVIVFGEIYGRGIQELTYGEATPVFRCFDISVNGLYLSHYLTMMLCKSYDIPTVPVLWVGAYSREKLNDLTDGKSTIAEHSREGVVVKALEETAPRQILKSVSVDYLARN